VHLENNTMEEISNRGLAVLIVVAIIISLCGTLISLNKLEGMNTITGMAQNDEGFVNLSIAGGISITTADNNRINFGACTPLGGGFIVITSEANASNCLSGDVGGTSSKNITVKNNGNVNVNVTMRSTDEGEAQAGTGGFLVAASTDDSYIAFKPMATWASGNGYGCQNNTILGFNSSWDANGHGWNSYQNITRGVNYTACGNLSYLSNANSFGIAIMIGIPQGVGTGHNNITLQFLGTNIGVS
jgi:hypothetical protein